MRILVVEARFYSHISDMLLSGAMKVLEQAKAVVDRVAVPGALEIPAVVGMASRTGHYDGYVALGCVIRGETYHFEIVANESSRSLMDLSLRHALAIGNGILTVEDEAQALRRADPTALNKGGAAAQACLELVQIRNHYNRGIL